MAYMLHRTWWSVQWTHIAPGLPGRTVSEVGCEHWLGKRLPGGYNDVTNEELFVLDEEG